MDLKYLNLSTFSKFVPPNFPNAPQSFSFNTHVFRHASLSFVRFLASELLLFSSFSSTRFLLSMYITKSSATIVDCGAISMMLSINLCMVTSNRKGFSAEP